MIPVGWQKGKPDFACVVTTRSTYTSPTGRTSTDYDLFLLEWTRCDEDDAYYLACMDKDGEEWCALEELTVDEYLVIEMLPTMEEVHKQMSKE